MNTSPATDGIGYLVVKVSTARGVIPLQNATVNIRGAENENSGVLFSLTTDRDGKTPRISLATPSRSASQTPNDAAPFATYKADVFLDGYLPLTVEQIPIFPSVLSIQPAVLIPSPAP